MNAWAIGALLLFAQADKNSNPDTAKPEAAIPPLKQVVVATGSVMHGCRDPRLMAAILRGREQEPGYQP